MPVMVDLGYATFLRTAGLVALGVSTGPRYALAFVLYGGPRAMLSVNNLSGHTSVAATGMTAVGSTSGPRCKDVDEKQTTDRILFREASPPRLVLRSKR